MTTPDRRETQIAINFCRTPWSVFDKLVATIFLVPVLLGLYQWLSSDGSDTPPKDPSASQQEDGSSWVLICRSVCGAQDQPGHLLSDGTCACVNLDTGALSEDSALE